MADATKQEPEGFSGNEADSADKTPEQSDQQQQATDPGFQSTTTTSTETQVQIPEKFLNEDKTVNTDLIVKSYLENEKLTGRLKNDLGQSRQRTLDLEQSQFRSQQVAQADTSQQPVAKGTASLKDKDWTNYEGVLAPADFQILGEMVDAQVQKGQQQYDQQVQEQRNYRKQQADKATERAVMELAATDPSINRERVIAMTQALQSDPARMRKYNDYEAGTGALDVNAITQDVEQLNALVKDSRTQETQGEVEQYLQNKLGFTKDNIDSLLAAKKAQAQNAVSPTSANGMQQASTDTAGMSAYEKKAFADFGLLSE